MGDLDGHVWWAQLSRKPAVVSCVQAAIKVLPQMYTRDRQAGQLCGICKYCI